MSKYILLDTETTNFRPGQISQLSYLLMDGSKILNARNYFFTVESINKGVIDLTGRNVRTLEFLSGGAKFCDLVEEIYQDISNSTILAYNANFDELFIKTEFERLNIPLNVEFKCVMRNSLPFIKQHLNWCKSTASQEDVKNLLGINDIITKTLCNKWFSSDIRGRHDSRWDVMELHLINEGLKKEGLYIENK